jgi:ketosteroid isomerase-like protein
MTKAQILQDWFIQVWVNGDLDAIERYLAPDMQAAGVMPDMNLEPEDFRVMVEAMTAQVTDLTFGFEHAIEQGDWVSALMSVKAKAADTGNPIHITGQIMARFEGDKIVEAYNHYDFIALFEQLDRLPEGTVGRCLMGEKIA